MGDWNEVGEKESGCLIGKYWLARKNGRTTFEFCKKNQLVATNTCFQQEGNVHEIDTETNLIRFLRERDTEIA